ncbi:MAG: glucose-1-phosphate adenylyltransferase [Pirellulaceae bacterium]
MNHVLAVILAGGKGTRLEPLTRDRAKPAVPFGGAYRIIDFAMSNCLNSGIRKVQILTQYKASSLDRHLYLGWQPLFCRELGEFVDILPPQQRIDENWYQGTADAVYQNIYSLEKERPRYVVVLAGDHIYKMNYRKMVEYHEQIGADLTIGALPVELEQGKQFGVMEVDEHDRIVGFEEKPKQPRSIPGNSGQCLASMGIYVFSANFLFEQLLKDANQPNSQHDFGKNIIPSVIKSANVFAFPFMDENRKELAYWRDVGTLDAYYEANMDLIAVEPELNIYDERWPLRTHQPNLPPPKFVFDDRNKGDFERVGCAVDSLVCNGTIISGGRVQRSVIGRSARVNSFAQVTDSILFDRVIVGRHAKVHRAIIDKDVVIPDGMEIGVDPNADRRRGLMVSDSGLVVVGKADIVANDNRPKFLDAARNRVSNQHESW